MHTIRPLQQGQIGLAFAVLAVASFSLQSIVLREAAHLLPPFVIVWLRSIFTLTFLIPYLSVSIMREASARPRLWLIARAALIGASMYCATIAVRHMSVFDFTLLQSTEAMFTFLIGALLLGERTRAAHWLSLTVGFAGTYIVLSPGLEGSHGAYGLLALASAALMAAATAILRVGRRRWHLAQVLLWQNLTCIGLFAWPGALDLRAVSIEALLLIALLSALQAIAQLAFGQAVRSAAISLIAPMFLGRLIFGALFGFLFYREMPSAVTLLGSAIICISIMIAVFGKPEVARAKA